MIVKKIEQLAKTRVINPPIDHFTELLDLSIVIFPVVIKLRDQIRSIGFENRALSTSS